MIVTVKGKREISEFYKQSDPRFNSPRFKNGKDVLTAWVDKYNNLITGLTEEDAERIGKKIGKDLSPLSPFWNDYGIAITDRDLILNTAYPEDELKYLVLKSHYRVQADPLTPKATADYVIHSTLDEAKRVNSKASLKVKAFSLYAKLTMKDKRDLLKLYPGYAKTDNVAEEIIEANLFKEIEKDYEKFINRVEDKDRSTKVMVEELVANRIITKNKNMYKYGDDVLGHNLEATIDHLNDPANQGLKIALMQELKEVKK